MIERSLIAGICIGISMCLYVRDSRGSLIGAVVLSMVGAAIYFREIAQ
jgi:hypothetical protein